MKRGATEWGRRQFILEVRCDGDAVRGSIRNLATGERLAFVGRPSFLRQMAALLDASAPPEPPSPGS